MIKHEQIFQPSAKIPTRGDRFQSEIPACARGGGGGAEKIERPIR